jgi:hypothetical protein
MPAAACRAWHRGELLDGPIILALKHACPDPDGEAAERLVGTLTCSISPAVGMIVGGQRQLGCIFASARGRARADRRFRTLKQSDRRQREGCGHETQPAQNKAQRGDRLDRRPNTKLRDLGRTFIGRTPVALQRALANHQLPRRASLRAARIAGYAAWPGQHAWEFPWRAAASSSPDRARLEQPAAQAIRAECRLQTFRAQPFIGRSLSMINTRPGGLTS